MPFAGADLDEVFARRLRALRESAGLTQRQLAEEMTLAGYRMHQTTIAKIEAASPEERRPVSIGEGATFARIMGVDLWTSLLSEAAPEEHVAELARALAERDICERKAQQAHVQVARCAADLETAQDALSKATLALAVADERVRRLRKEAGR